MRQWAARKERGVLVSYCTESRALLFGLLIECPFKDPDPECPVLDMRERDIQKMKQMAFSDIDDEQMQFILKRHRSCCSLRDAAVLH